MRLALQGDGELQVKVGVSLGLLEVLCDGRPLVCRQRVVVLELLEERNHLVENVFSFSMVAKLKVAVSRSLTFWSHEVMPEGAKSFLGIATPGGEDR